MTVRETVKFIPQADVLKLVFDGTTYPFDPDNIFLMSAFGDFDVSKVDTTFSADPAEKAYELIIACKPLKNGVPA